MKSRTVWSRGVQVYALVSIALLAGCGGGSGNSTSSGSNRSVTSVQVTPASATVYQGQTVQFQAVVAGQSDQTVTWSIQQGGLGTIDNTGLYTAPKDASGPSQVVATSKAETSAKGYAQVTVVPPKLSVSPSVITLAPGGTQTFTASIEGLDDKTVTWAVEEPAGGFIDSTGSYTAPLSMGFFHAIATSVADGNLSASASITVTTSSSSFTPTGDMKDARGIHTATLLPNGKVLVAGGAKRSGHCFGGMSSAELYDPASGSFSGTGSLKAVRYAHTATLLQNGKVLVAGGFGSISDCEDVGQPAESVAELYDASAGTFALTGNMTEARGGHTATLLPNGKVLIAGGGDDSGGGNLPFYGTSSRTAELYDPVAGVFTATGIMATARFGHTATLLDDGKVLIVGGVESDNSLSSATATAEIYDPTTEKFLPTGSLTTPRAGHTATVLADGKVLITGGLTDANDSASVTSTAEIYDPSTGAFTPAGEMGIGRVGHTATMLHNGTVLIAGGEFSSPVAFAETYDPSTRTFTPTGSMETGRVWHSATLLQNEEVLVAGSGFFLSSAELYK